MKRAHLVIPILLMTCCTIFSQETESKEYIRVGHNEKFYSTLLQEERILEVSLPSGFKSGKEIYPLVIVLDGGSLFRYVRSSLDILTPNFFPEMVVIGLPNTDRGRDLDVRQGYRTGADKFRLFLNTELLPFIKNKYGTADFNILMGHSLAGLFALDTLLEGKSRFQAVIASSPSLASAEGQTTISNSLKSVIPGQFKGKFLFLSAGGDESDELKAFLPDLESRLKKSGFEGFTVELRIFEGEGHFPLKGFYQGLRSLFAEWGPPRKWFFEGTLSELIEHYNIQAAKLKMVVTPPSDLIWSLRNRLKREKEFRN